MTDERWHRILRLMDEAYADYLTGMASLRGRVVADLGPRGLSKKTPPSNSEDERQLRSVAGQKLPVRAAAKALGISASSYLREHLGASQAAEEATHA